jgi:histidinol-phosphate phosphatase family protein
VDQLEIFPDAADALGRFKEAGYLLIVVTNQPDVARGTQTRWAVDGINTAIGEALPVDEFLVCAHDDAANCLCRKPKPGMVLDAAARHAVDLQQSFLIGDRWRDIDCGASAGSALYLSTGAMVSERRITRRIVAESLEAAAIDSADGLTDVQQRFFAGSASGSFSRRTAIHRLLITRSI